MEILDMISSVNTSNAYIIPERCISVLNLKNLRQNGRPVFHVVKERFGK